MGAMISYYKGTNVLYCPAAPFKGNPSNAINPPGKADSAWNWTISDPAYSSSYGINKWLAYPPGLGNSTSAPYLPFLTEASVRFPSQTPMFMDAAWINFDPLKPIRPARNLYDPLNSASQSGGAPQ